MYNNLAEVQTAVAAAAAERDAAEVHQGIVMYM